MSPTTTTTTTPRPTIKGLQAQVQTQRLTIETLQADLGHARAQGDAARAQVVDLKDILSRDPSLCRHPAVTTIGTVSAFGGGVAYFCNACRKELPGDLATTALKLAESQEETHQVKTALRKLQGEHLDLQREVEQLRRRVSTLVDDEGGGAP